MKNKRKNLIIKVLFFITIVGTILLQPQALANKASELERISRQEYTEEYKEWLELPEDKRKNRLEPRRFDVEYENSYSTYLKGINNKIKVAELLKSSSAGTYNLKDYISKSVQIKNQQQTNMCWAFAGTATLESHLALKHYKSTNENLEYDFSERHMAYSTAKNSLLNSGNNLFAFNASVAEGGNYFMAEQYLTTGNGAILENDMPFENTEQPVDISVIQGKDVATTLLDTTLFATDSQTTKTELITQMKNYITNYGGIYAGIHGAAILSDYYNNETGAIYCNNSANAPMNHAVLIIGWDDNYNRPTNDENYVNKFNANCTPESYGAWIIKNSWGDYITESLSELKIALWNNSQTVLEQQGYNSAEEIPNDLILQLLQESYGESKVAIDAENDTITLEIGDKGYMYVSYDDINVYSYLWGIENAKETVDYDNLYQHDHLGGMGYSLTYLSENKPIYMANVFTRDTNKREELTKISLYTNQEYTCKVYVNPTGSTLDANLANNEVTLAKGNADNTINIKPGYHTIEFAQPIELTGNQFAVALEITNSFSTKKIALEYPSPGGPFANAVFNEGESFISISDMSEWVDTAELATSFCDGNVTIKAFTNNISDVQEPEPEALELQEIQISEVAEKLTYYVGEDFDATGMVVKAIYYNSAKREEKDVTNDITVINGTNLQLGQTAVTISYTDGEITKTTTQAIVVQEEVIEEPEVLELQEIQIIEEADKLTYYVGEDFDATGMVVKAIYYNSAKREEKDVTNDIRIINGTNLQLDQNTVTISYTDGEITKTTTQAIVVQEEVIEEPVAVLEKVEVSKLPSKLEYIKDVEQLNLAGGIIKATYSNDTEIYVDMTNEMVTATGFNNTKLGKNTITVDYASKTTTFDVQIIEDPEEEPEEKEPVLSDFDDSKAVMTEMDMPSNSKDNYIMTLKVDGINIGDENTDYKYYWYISGRLGENNIQDNLWTEINKDKIIKQADGTYSLIINIDSRNLSNKAELITSDNLYLYIKEVATLGDNVKEQIISKPVDIDIEVEEDTSDKIDETLEKEESDDTLADVEIPKAGINVKIIIFIILIAVTAVFAYNRFKYFDI